VIRDHHSRPGRLPHEGCPCCDAVRLVLFVVQWGEHHGGTFDVTAAGYRATIDERDRLVVGGLAIEFGDDPNPGRIAVWTGDKEVLAFDEDRFEKLQDGPWITELTTIVAAFETKFGKNAPERWQ
jgi:hypothetical protein